MNKNVSTDKCVENFIKDCADICTAKKINSFIDAVGEELSQFIYREYYMRILKYNSTYLFIGYKRKEYIIKFDSYPTAVYLFRCIGLKPVDVTNTFYGLTSADFVYDEPEVEQDGYIYNIICRLGSYENNDIFVIDAKTRERILSIGNTRVYYTKLFLKRFPSITNDELANYYLPERIKQKIMAIKVMNMLKE